MNLDLLVLNLTNPPVLFFILGVIASLVRSNLEFPAPIPKLFSLYLLFAIGFKGGEGLAHSSPTWDSATIIAIAIGSSFLVPVGVFFISRRFFTTADAAAIGATYGSVSAVTFITACTFLDNLAVSYGGYMVAALALMESPAIIVGLLLAQRFSENRSNRPLPLRHLLHEAVFDGSVFLLLGSLAIGWISSEDGVQLVKPMTGGLFYGALCIFLLDMGITASRRMGDLKKNAVPALLVGVGVPLVNATIAILISRALGFAAGDALLLTVLLASGSYIAVPAALRQALPEANPGVYLPMSLAITFPLNISVGIPLYYFLLGGTDVPVIG